MTTSLPASVLDMVEMSPVEDLLLAVLRDRFPDIPVRSLIAPNQAFPFILARTAPAWAEWTGDPRFLDAGTVGIHVFCDGPNADEDAALLSEAVRVAMRDCVNDVVPNRGYFTKTRLASRARRQPDWATATGPVQYADLPTGVVRYESQFLVEIRKPRTRPFPSSP